MQLRVALLVLPFAAACSPPVCDPISNAAQAVCHRADAGTITAGTAFTLESTTYIGGGTCQVSVDGGQIGLVIAGTASCGDRPSGAAAPRGPSTVACAIPALPAGTYTVAANPGFSFTIPESADAGVPTCN